MIGKKRRNDMDKVLKFVRKREYQGEVDVELEKTCLRFCEYVIIDEEERVIRCKDCNRMVDPFEYLLEFATKNKRMWKHANLELKFIEDEIEEKKKELAALKRKVRAAKNMPV
jgi:hypothetical protein